MNPIQEYQLDGIRGNLQLFQKFPGLGSFTDINIPRIPFSFIRHKAFKGSEQIQFDFHS
jgi:hypothetical protein